MKKEKQAKLSMQPYRTNVIVWVCSPEEATKGFKKTVYYTEYGGCPDSFIPLGGRCINVENANYEPIVWIDEKIKKQDRCISISHEFIHVINAIFKCRGVKLDYDNDEPYAYMMTYLMTQAQKHDFI